MFYFAKPHTTRIALLLATMAVSRGTAHNIWPPAVLFYVKLIRFSVSPGGDGKVSGLGEECLGSVRWGGEWPQLFVLWWPHHVVSSTNVMVCNVHKLEVRKSTGQWAGTSVNVHARPSVSHVQYGTGQENVHLYKIQFVQVNTYTSTPQWARHRMLRKLLWWSVSTGGWSWSGQNFYFRSINVDKCFLHKVAPRSVFYGHLRAIFCRKWCHLGCSMDILFTE